MPAQTQYFYNGDIIADSPATKKINIAWLGNLKAADLVLLFGGKFGWELQYAELNGRRFQPTKINEIRVSGVQASLINGENTLVVVYTYIGLGNTTNITAYVVIDSDLGTFQWPSITQWLQDLNTKLKDATAPTLILIGLIAAIVIAIAFIVTRAPRLPNLAGAAA